MIYGCALANLNTLLIVFKSRIYIDFSYVLVYLLANTDSKNQRFFSLVFLRLVNQTGALCSSGLNYSWKALYCTSLP